MRLDETELNILKEMSKGARISYNNLAEKIGVSTPTISKKIEKLKDMGVIKGFSIHIDYDKVGYLRHIIQLKVELYRLLYLEKELSKIDDVRTIFRLDERSIMAVVESQDIDDLDETISVIRDFEGVIDIDIQRITKHVKDEMELSFTKRPEVDIGCYYCHKKIEGEPVKLNLDKKEHYLCCETCAEQYKEKYKEIKAKSEI